LRIGGTGHRITFMAEMITQDNYWEHTTKQDLDTFRPLDFGNLREFMGDEDFADYIFKLDRVREDSENAPMVPHIQLAIHEGVITYDEYMQILQQKYPPVVESLQRISHSEYIWLHGRKIPWLQRLGFRTQTVRKKVVL
jgi:hypothetical protein